MTSVRSTRVLAILGAFALVPAALAGCSTGESEPGADTPAPTPVETTTPTEEASPEPTPTPTPKAESQSLDEACTMASETMTAEMEKYGDDIGALVDAGDAEGAQQAVKNVTAAVEVTQKTITHDEVASAFESFGAANIEIWTMAADIAGIQNPDEKQAAMDEFSAQQGAIIQEGAADLDGLCSDALE